MLLKDLLKSYEKSSSSPLKTMQSKEENSYIAEIKREIKELVKEKGWSITNLLGESCLDLPLYAIWKKIPNKPTIFICCTLNGEDTVGYEGFMKWYRKLPNDFSECSIVALPLANFYGYVSRNCHDVHDRDLNTIWSSGKKENTNLYRWNVCNLLENFQPDLFLHIRDSKTNEGYYSYPSNEKIKLLYNPTLIKAKTHFNSSSIGKSIENYGSLESHVRHLNIPYLSVEIPSRSYYEDRLEFVSYLLDFTCKRAKRLLTIS